LSVCTAGQVLDTAGPAVCGVTLLSGEIYLLRPKPCDQIEVYHVISHCLLRRLTVPDVHVFVDMTSCEHHRCLYIGDPNVECVHRLEVGQQGAVTAVTQWAVKDSFVGLSVNAAHNVIVTCNTVRKIKEFSSRGGLLRVLELPDNVTQPSYAVQLSCGHFIVCNGDPGDYTHRVCKISEDCRRIVQSHGGRPGAYTGLYHGRVHLVVDDDECVIVVDAINWRVTLLSSTLNFVREVVSRDQLKGWPGSLYLDKKLRYLYVVDNWKDTRGGCNSTAGRVVVFKFDRNESQ